MRSRNLSQDEKNLNSRAFPKTPKNAPERLKPGIEKTRETLYIGVTNNQNKETLVMKTITEIIGGAQGLLNISYDLRDVFEEYLTDEYKTFLHMLRVLEGAQNPLIRSYAGTGSIPYQYLPFIRTVLAKCFFKITTTTQLIKQLKTDSTLRLLCGFEKVPGRSTFSRNFTELSEMNIMSETLDALVKEAHEGKVVYHVSRDSMAIEARKRRKRRRRNGAGNPKRGRFALQSRKLSLRDKCVKVPKTH
jgi:transposase